MAQRLRQNVDYFKQTHREFCIAKAVGACTFSSAIFRSPKASKSEARASNRELRLSHAESLAVVASDQWCVPVDVQLWDASTGLNDENNNQRLAIWLSRSFAFISSFPLSTGHWGTPTLCAIDVSCAAWCINEGGPDGFLHPCAGRLICIIRSIKQFNSLLLRNLLPTGEIDASQEHRYDSGRTNHLSLSLLPNP